ncbi:MAG: hypothetical protein Q4D05_06670 [Acinetobacter sp.]|nr:hypothetical protein [Acinetobacter sp.]
MLDLAQLIQTFMTTRVKVKNSQHSHKDVEICNEFSFQHELGIFLREQLHGLGYKIQFERNISFFGANQNNIKFVKKEIDICIFNADNPNERYAIELKCPRNGQVPEQMYSFAKDIQFMEQLKQGLGFGATFFVAFVDHAQFYKKEKGKLDGIYGYFRAGEILKGKISKLTGADKGHSVELQQEYQIKWFPLENESDIERFCIVSI